MFDLDGEERIVNSRADIGADELYSCDDDLSEDDIYNSLDWNFDGLVNYIEFAEFSDVWLIRDPNDPGYSPVPEEYAIWTKARRCNFDKDYDIDIDDLIYLANEWAWRACWKYLSTGFGMMSMAGGMEMMSLEPAATPQPETTIEDKIEQAKNGLDFLNEVLDDEELKETIDLDNLQKVIDSLGDLLDELEEEL